ncbi:MAG: L-serine ammonia-lyase, iron-sulfur-dependent subunit beta [Candidatus Sericytochromatia bacterium]|nr:L-serine ammonia-lyase, iron-sulfur-dependent subunit beta [Candidatus Tanganyikabacteria bacterium]
MGSYESIFSIIGPVMVGPSSSHTAGAVRIGQLARSILGETPSVAEIFLHGSFAETGPGHGTDKAIVAGLLGLETWDDRVKDAFDLAHEAGFKFGIKAANLGPRMHPCSTRLVVTSRAGLRFDIVGSSLGGGSVVLTEINGFEVKLSGEYHTLVTVHADRPGIIREVSTVLGDHQVNIAFMKVARKHKGDEAFMTVETDEPIAEACVAAIRAIDGMHSVRFLRIDMGGSHPGQARGEVEG